MRKLIQKIYGFNQLRQWNQGQPAEYATSVSIESAELLELFQWGKTPDNHEVGAEIADIFWYLLTLCAKLDIDLETVVTKKLEHNLKKYPIGSNYIAQKRMYRS